MNLVSDAATSPAVRAKTSPRPLRDTLALAGLAIGVTAVGSLVVELVAPDSDQLLRRLPVVLVLLATSLVVTRRTGWAAVGAGRPSTWREVGWLTAPVLVALIPLAWGWAPNPSTLLALAVGYAATGVYEELWFRGVMLRAALPLGPGRAAALTAAVFGASHLANILFGQNIAITAAQAVGAAAFGFGYAVLRLRTNALWVLVGTHGVLDLLLHTTRLHGAALWGVMVGQDLVLLVVGLVALRGMRGVRGIERSIVQSPQVRPARTPASADWPAPEVRGRGVGTTEHHPFLSKENGMYTKRMHEIRRTMHQRRIHQAQRKVQDAAQHEQMRAHIHAIVR